MIFFDRSILRGVAEAVKQVRDDAVWLEDVFTEHWVGETEWMPVVGDRGWVAVLRDMKVLSRPEERRAIRESSLGCFIFNYRTNKTRWETLKLVCATLDEMEAKFGNTPRPFIFLIDGTGRFRQIPA